MDWTSDLLDVKKTITIPLSVSHVLTRTGSFRPSFCSRLSLTDLPDKPVSSNRIFPVWTAMHPLLVKWYFPGLDGYIYCVQSIEGNVLGIGNTLYCLGGDSIIINRTLTFTVAGGAIWKVSCVYGYDKHAWMTEWITSVLLVLLLLSLNPLRMLKFLFLLYRVESANPRCVAS